MFQTFTAISHKPFLQDRLTKLRSLFKTYNIDGYFVPHSDEFNNEYLPECHKRFEFITGFTGSWGVSLILKDKAYLFIDSRYVLQAPQETDLDIFECICVSDTPLKDYLSDEKFNDLTIGYDSALQTPKEIERLTDYLPKSVTLKSIPNNLIDKLLESQKAQFPNTEIIAYPLEYAGKTAQEKINEICAELKKNQINSTVIALPESLCWLLNVRASDVPHTPYVLSYGIIHQSGIVDWFVGKERITDIIKSHLPDNVQIYNRQDFYPALANLHGTVQNDSDNNSAKIYQTLKDNKNVTHLINKADPCLLPKAIKNDAEIKATTNAHIRDGLAVIRFACWLEENYKNKITEIDCVKKLEELRRETGALQDVSFDTISGSGANGALVHYRVSEKTNRILQEGELFLLDSGGQYLDGTTDITRTFAIGTPSDEMKMRYTQVLKGHLALAMAKFPEKTTGATLDILARMPLWQAGVDYGHGTGHGVGVYLSVHEGPQSISSRSNIPLQPGMIVSNEPGYYKTGAFGIRIENLQYVTSPKMIEHGEKPMLGFETLTMVPYERKLINVDLLTDSEISFVNDYHVKILEVYKYKLSKNDLIYLNSLFFT